jgi:hypothetical protein
MLRGFGLAITACAAALLLVACDGAVVPGNGNGGGGSPTPNPSGTPAPTASPTPQPTASPDPSPTPTPNPSLPCAVDADCDDGMFCNGTENLPGQHSAVRPRAPVRATRRPRNATRRWTNASSWRTRVAFRTWIVPPESFATSTRGSVCPTLPRRAFPARACAISPTSAPAAKTPIAARWCARSTPAAAWCSGPRLARSWHSAFRPAWPRSGVGTGPAGFRLTATA